MEEPMTIPKPTLDPRLSYGNVIQIFLLLVLIAGWGIYIVRWQSSVDSKIAENEAARIRYIPIIEALVKSDAIQEERMGNMADAVIEMRRGQSALAEKLGTIGTSIAVIEERTKLSSEKVN